MEFIDFSDSTRLWEFSQETVNLAQEYQEVRIKYAEGLKLLKIGLAKAYQDSEIKETISEDKAYLQLVNLDEVYKEALSDVIVYEQTYKGLEKVIDARQAMVSLNQSIIKNQVNNS